MDEFVRVPAWMVTLIVWILGALGTGASMTIGAIVIWAFRTEKRINTLEANINQNLPLLIKKIDEHAEAFHRLEMTVIAFQAKFDTKRDC